MQATIRNIDPNIVFQNKTRKYFYTVRKPIVFLL